MFELAPGHLQSRALYEDIAAAAIRLNADDGTGDPAERMTLING